MRRPNSLLRSAGLALGLAATALLTNPASAQVYPGYQAKYEFTKPLVNGRGTTKLADLEGKLVWVEFWGTY